MKVLLFNGSPHKWGCTYAALKEIANTLNQEGIDTEIYQIGEKSITPCKACYACVKNGKCIITDDEVNNFVEKCKDFDGFIFGSPVHYGSASGGITAFMDRAFFSASKSGNINIFAHKPASAIVSARRAGTTAALDQLMKYFTISEMTVISGRYWNMVHGHTPDDVRKDEEGMQNMRILARNMAWHLKCLQAAKNAGIVPPEREKIIVTNFINNINKDNNNDNDNDKKVSVIIPTLLKNEDVLGALLNNLDRDEYVDEILLINNTPWIIDQFKNINKLIIFNNTENNYVNPSWNFGIKQIKNDLFLIINDDILPVDKFVEKVVKSGILNDYTTGLVGINPKYINQYSKTNTTSINSPVDNQSELRFERMNNYLNTGDWGSAFFGRVSNYYQIPDDLKIIYGDNYLLHQNIMNNKINYMLSGIQFNHIHSLSSGSPEFTDIIRLDMINSKKYF